MKKITFVIFMSLLSFLGFAQFPESFDTGIPGTWNVMDNGTGTAQSWTTTSTLFLPTHSGTQHALIDRGNIGVGNTAEDWLVTPQFTVPTNGQLRFWTKMTLSGDFGTLFQLRVSTTSQTDQASFTQIQQWTEAELETVMASGGSSAHDVYGEIVKSLSAYVGQNIYVAFVRKHTQNGTTSIPFFGERWLIDDVNVVQQCADPLTLTAGTVTATSAILNWTSPGPATTWDIEMVAVPGTPTGVPTRTGVTKPYTYTGLTPGTQYNYYVRSVCGPGNVSNWAGPFIFNTIPLGQACSGPIPVTSLPYTHTSNTGLYGDVVDGSPGASCGITGNYLNGNDVFYSFTPSFTGIADISMTPTGNNSGVFVYGSCADVGITCLAGAANTGGGIRNIPAFNVTAGTTYYIVISTSGSPQSIPYTLNIQQVNCEQPTALTTTAIGQNTATLGWTSAFTGFQYVVQPVGTGLPMGVGIDVTGTSVPVSGLTQNTQYEFYVRADCGGGLFSIWAGPFTFRTLCGPIAVPFAEGFNSTSTTQICWTVANVGADANAWNMDYTSTPYEGNQSASIISSLATNDDWLMSPQITLNGNQRLRYRYRVGSATSPCNFEIKVSTTGPIPTNFTTTILPQTTYSNATYLEKTINLTGITGDVNIGWHVAPGANGSRIFIDQVIVENIPACPEPMDLAVSSIGPNSASVNWTPGGTETTWQVLVQPTGSPAPTSPTQGTTVTTPPPYLATGLLGSTSYDVYVLANCGGNGPSVWTGPVTFVTLVALPVCGGTFFDTGGSIANYSNNEDVTWTVNPVNAGDVVTVTFSAFNTQASNDALYVFNGNSTAAPQIMSVNGAGAVPGVLAGGYWGTAIPGPFTSSAADGSLTFRFRSNGSTTAAGWAAMVSCAPRVTCEAPHSLIPSAVTHNSVTLGWAGGTATAWQVIAVPCGSPRPTGATSGWVDASTNPYTLTGLTGQTCYDFYVRGICSPTDASAVVGPVSATTLITPPQCGGQFTDTGGASNGYSNNENTTWTICPNNPGDLVTVTFTSFNTEENWDGLYVYDGNSTAAPLIPSGNGTGSGPLTTPGAYWGTDLPGPFVATSTSGCLTFVFKSDGSGIGEDAPTSSAGWIANVTCTPQPNCTKPTTLTVSNIQATSALLGWTETGVSTQWEIFAVPFGSPAPTGTDTGVIVNTNPVLFTGLNPSTHYIFYVRSICPTSGTSFWSTGLQFYTTPANDNCVAATFVPVNANGMCNQTVSGSLAYATASTPPIAGCAGTADDDVWFQFIATNPYLQVTLQDLVGVANTEVQMAVYSGSCSGLAQIACVPDNSEVLNGLIVGQTYFIRVYTDSPTPTPVSFDMCITTPSTCSNATTICTTTPYTYVNTTDVTSQGQVGCLGTTPNPTYFVIQVSQSGPIQFVISQSSTGSTTANLDVDYAAWGPYTSQAAACGTGIPNIPPINLSPPGGDPQDHGCSYNFLPIEQFNIPNAIAGEVYILLVTNFANQAGSITISQTNVGLPGAGATTCCPEAFFNYTPASYCIGNSANPIATIPSGSVAGVFSSTNPNVVFANTATGEINLAATPAGSYLITNTLNTFGCGTKTSNFVVTITQPNNASIQYPAVSYCQNTAGTVPLTITGDAGGSLRVNPLGLYIDTTTGAITPGLSAPGTYTVEYYFPTSNGCGAVGFPTTVTILPLPVVSYTVVQPTCTVPTATVSLQANANYEYSINGGTAYVTNNVFAGLVPGGYNFIVRDITTGCTNTMNVTINGLPASPAAPSVTAVDPTCSTDGSITVNPPTSGITGYSNLFISEVTDANSGTLSYVEIFNGTGAAVNLANYKLKVYTTLSGTATCDLALAGTLAHNSAHVVAIGSATNAGGVVPNQVFAACAGINENDNIRLTTAGDLEIDNWGRRDGVNFTPANLPGYTFRRLNTVMAPSNIWNASDWTALDPEDYTNVGSYTAATVNYSYSIDGVNYQSNPQFTPLAAGSYNVTAMDPTTGCVSAATPVTLTFVNTLAMPTISTSLPTCTLDGVSTITNYDNTLIYVFTPSGPTVGASGQISGMTVGVSYTVVSSLGDCLSPASASFSNDPMFTAMVPTIESTPPTCTSDGISTIVDYDGTLTYTFSPAGPTVNATGLISGMTIGVNYTVTANNGTCTSATSASFSNAVMLVSPVAPIVNEVLPATCTADGISAITNYDGTLTYSFTPSGPTVNGSGTIIGMTAGMNYTVTANNGTCTSVASASFASTAMLVSPAVPTIEITPATCASVGISTITNYDGTLTYTFTPSGPTVDTNGIIDGMTVGTNYTVVASNGNCASSVSNAFAIDPMVTPVVIDFTGVCVNGAFTLTATPTSDLYSYEWFDVNGVSLGTSPTQVVTSSGNYTLDIDNGNGCVSSITKFVTETICTIPRGISPNGDGKNDNFDLTELGVRKIAIFNRYGVATYTYGSGYTNQWHGQSDKGQELPDGTYYYVIEAGDGSTKTGWVYINREQ